MVVTDVSKSNKSPQLNDQQIKDLVDKDLEKLVLTLLKKELKGKDMEERMSDISKDVLVSLYKTLWMRRNFWVNNLGK